jgi:transcriptional regulator with XRE-family HTH domain
MGLSMCQNIGMPINEIISALREAEGVTVRELAKRAGTHENTIFRAERGEGINWNTAEKVLDALGHQVLVVPNDAKKLASSETSDHAEDLATA